MPDRSEALQGVIDACLEHADQLPLRRRVKLYLQLAEVCGDPHESVTLRKLARDLDDADRRCREFAFGVKEGQ